jgi:hypothetical protein
MFYNTIKDSKRQDFKRLTGVHKETFQTMLDVLNQGIRAFGRPPKLALADRLLMTLMYWREYPTQFHIATTYGVSEATVCRTLTKVEKVLMQSGKFRLPGKKALLDPDKPLEVVVIDATECPVERPKKNSESTTAAKRSATPTKRK